MFKLADNVRIVFDHPGRHRPSPKGVERSRRDATGVKGCTRKRDEPIAASTPCPPSSSTSLDKHSFA